MHASSPGLRERHRLRTIKELNRAAVELVMEHGLTAVTVEAIADRAGVSRRTFFNYFATKEDAVLGTRTPTVPEDALNRFLDGDEDDQFTRTIRLIVAILRSTIADSSSYRERAALTHRFPELRERLLHHVSAAERLVETILDDKLSASGAAARESSRALLMLAGTVLRFVYARDPASVEPDQTAAIESAIATFKKVLEDIS
ncbi:helix-turn-helix domain-containing protein [Acrocarpospora sp. B8E8]|uniref:TetR/AcrR family transcriptional regulator n=1 Tax=Acrocarpospora sp. B8E8 TaxID=3153572 RepID=UPI00325CF7E5